MTYCTRQDVLERLSESGMLFVADDNNGDDLSRFELEQSLDSAILASQAEIDVALTRWVNLPIEPTVDWLRFRAVDLAAERLAGRKGSPVPQSLAMAAERARIMLDAVRAGAMRIPGLSYRVDSVDTGLSRSGAPRVANPIPVKDEKECSP